MKTLAGLCIGIALATSAQSADVVRTGPPKGLTSQPDQTDSRLTAEIRSAFRKINRRIEEAAQLMPEDGYGFRPQDKLPTFGELATHVATTQFALCGSLNGHALATVPKKASKEQLLKLLGQATVECDTAYAELSAENAEKKVSTPAGELTHLAALVSVNVHAGEEYGQMETYLRLRHIDPPASDKPEKVL